MQSRVEEAATKKMRGYNCAQAVACTYCDLAGINEDTMKNITQGFAVGMGGSMEGTCGALIGATCVLGIINQNPQKTMKETREMMLSFKEQNGTVVCKELKGLADGKKRRECIDCVRDAARLVETKIE
ncbi:MAG: C-GCAxxG-C-C family protein [Lachnospiraceae bacterium]|nr:C-GCAxxG-C-C family protein [Lachnospiraceae bacterium]